jgi:penicillin G amidase
MRWFKRWTLGVLWLVALLALAAGIYVWKSLPQLDGERSVAGLRGPVSVHRDSSDVTHIEATNPRDAWMAMGYVHAQERGWQMAFNRRLMRGTLSELLGPATLETDMLMRTLGIRAAARRQLDGFSHEAREALQAYSRGVNAFFAQRTGWLSPEFLILGEDPSTNAAAGQYWEPEDTAGWSIMMALDLGGNWGNELARLSALQVLDTEALWQLFPAYPGEQPASRASTANWACTRKPP